MRFKLILSILAVGLLVVSCLLPWMTIESKGITITGVDATGTDYGRPGFFHFFWGGLYLVLILINRVWSKRTAIILAAFNIAWMFRNFLLLPACLMGECPVRKAGLYLLLVASLMMFITPMLTKERNNSSVR